MLVDFDGDVADRKTLLESLQKLNLDVYSFADAGVALEDFYLDLIKESK